jgi:hypothetical protein
MAETLPGVRQAPETLQERPDDAPGPAEEREGNGPHRWDKEAATAASLLARESLRSGRARRESAQPGDTIRYLRVPLNAAATVRKLATEAQRGSTHASRELRAWMDILEADVPVSTSELDARTRQALLTRLLAELRNEDAESA